MSQEMGRLLKTYQRKQIIHAPIIDCKCIYYTHSTPFAISYQDQTNVVYQDPPYLARPLMKKKLEASYVQIRQKHGTQLRQNLR